MGRQSAFREDNGIRQSYQQLSANYQGLSIRTQIVEIEGESYAVSSHFKDAERLKAEIARLIQTKADRESGIGK